MKIVMISDSHGKHNNIKNLPSADMIIHAGDFTTIGKEYEIKDFMKWYSKLPYKHKLIVAGNHDWLFETNPLLAKELVSDDVVYLEDSGVEIEGLYFYGSPVQKPFHNWAFNRPEEKLKEHWEAIPNKTDVLITHNPPYKIGDYAIYGNEHTGSPSLRDEVVNRVKPMAHIFGHIHEGYGVHKFINDDTIFINASILDERYYLINKPILIEIIDKYVNVIDF